jgi:DNA-directed RNA polymerase specialized sigma24 family protein
VEQSNNPAQSGDDDAVASSRYRTSARLVAAIHRGDETAIRELFLLYVPLLRDQACRMGIAVDQRDDLVTILLDDVVLHLMETQIAPRHLTRYLIASLRNRTRNAHRNSLRRHDIRQAAYREIAGSGQRVVAECHSAYGMRASMHPDDYSHPLRAPIAGLAERAAQQLSHDEMVMLVCVGRHVPLREIAEQLRISYGAARVRLHRLRERFRQMATEYVAGLKAPERQELERFFRRAEVSLTRPVLKQQEKSNGQV